MDILALKRLLSVCTDLKTYPLSKSRIFYIGTVRSDNLQCRQDFPQKKFLPFLRILDNTGLMTPSDRQEGNRATGHQETIIPERRKPPIL